MFKEFKKEMQWGGKTLSIETGKIARQADGAVLVKYEGTTVLATVVAAKKPMEGVDFFPLSVHYQEKKYAAGKIPGGFFKREARPSEKETLISRLIDRPIRPLFPKTFKNETQVICTVVEHDGEHDSDVVAMIGASAALSISGIPFMGPIAGAKVGYKDGEYILNPTMSQLKETELELSVAGTNEGVLMVESEAKGLTEEVMLGAVMFGWESFQDVIKMIEELKSECGKEQREIPALPYNEAEVKAKMKELVDADLQDAFTTADKVARGNKVGDAHAKVLETMIDEEAGLNESAVSSIFKSVESDVVRGNILSGKPRIDGRDTKTVRAIKAEVGVLPGTHGSALFTRGETQAIVVTTLGTGSDEQIIDGLTEEYKENFMLHYNFPSYSVGECGRMSGPGRREIGHGKLAWRAIKAQMPSKEDFPYTIRAVSEITESNGSSSMATVCGTSLALMDAGVPVPAPVAGIAMGLIKEGDDFAVLTDILGDEDHLGDMDFKVAGTKEGINALQMDIKITSITKEIMEQALAQAKDARIHILGEMANAIEQSRLTVAANAPRIESITIPADKIREVIGTGGKVIKEIVEVSGAVVEVEEQGKYGIVKVASSDAESLNTALKMVNDIVAEPEAGTIYTGKVVKIMDFGAFVNFMGKNDGLVHISEIAQERVNKVEDYLKEGQEVKVKFVGTDNRGKFKLSMKVVNQETGEEIKIEKPTRDDKGGKGKGDKGGKAPSKKEAPAKVAKSEEKVKEKTEKKPLKPHF
ncbi:MAG: polyribonucleotide nucleotidyltransferase [Alphaproteobacteria bacterium]|nr:polyribonucleotide nucleotidyltransferase [Alphaproteobacteria bacterium]